MGARLVGGLPMTAAVDVLLPIISLAIAAGAVWIHRRRAGVTFVGAHVALAGGTVSVIGAVGLFRAAAAATHATGLVEMEQVAAEFGFARALLALAGVLIGATGFAGSLVALARLQRNTGVFCFPGQRRLNLLLLLAAGVLGVMIAVQLDGRLIGGYVSVCLALGVGLALPVALADLPRLIGFGSTLTGLALACTGLALRSPALAVAGMLVGLIGVLRTRAAMASERPTSDAGQRPLGAP